MAFKIFVSYSKQDAPRAERLAQQLQSTPINVYIAEHPVLQRRELSLPVARAIIECDIFVLVWSKYAQESECVQQEIGRASILDKPILPLILSERIELPNFLRNLNCLLIGKDPIGSLSVARSLILAEYQRREQQRAMLTQANKDKDVLALMGIGAFLLWAFGE
jgi:hypothetical protein